MKLGNRFFFLFLTYLIYNTPSFAEEKILSAPLINLDELKPSYEEVDDEKNTSTTNQFILSKKKKSQNSSSPSAKFIGLDKITAKTTNITIKLGETEKFGPLEIKVLKCGIIDNSNNIDGAVAYLQVKDKTENENEKVFIFNGWTFSSDPTITPFDHAIYDIQLVSCSNV